MSSQLCHCRKPTCFAFMVASPGLHGVIIRASRGHNWGFPEGFPGALLGLPIFTISNLKGMAAKNSNHFLTAFDFKGSSLTPADTGNN